MKISEKTKGKTKESKQKFSFQDIAQQTLNALGGEKNIKDFTNCASRLRVQTLDDKKVDVKKLKQISLVKGYLFSSGQHQIIFGTGTVNKFVEAFSKLFKQRNNDKKMPNQIVKTPLWSNKLNFWKNIFNILKRSVKGFADIFVPIIPVLIVGGLSLALSSFLGSFIEKDANGNMIASANQALYDFRLIFDIIGGAILSSLPVFVGYSTAKKFGGTPLLGVAVGLTLISTSLLDAWTANPDEISQAGYFFDGIIGGQVGLGWFEKIGYQAQAIPTIAIVYLMCLIERILTKWIPNVLYLVTVPLFTVFLTFFIGMWIIGPIGREVSDGLGCILTWVTPDINPWLSGIILAFLGLIYAPIVLTGFHQGLGPIEFQVVAQAHGEPSTYLTSIATISNIAQGTAALVVVFIVANQAIKNIGVSGSISAFAGITEPAMFGINIRLLFPFIAAMIGSFCGGFFIGFTKTLATSPGSASWIGIAVGQWSWTIDSGLGISHALTQIIGNCLTIIIVIPTTYVFAKTKFGKNQIKNI